ncbi:MAG: hypothetical protein ACM3S2_10115 [Ignavibacteriales bacterium]
MEKQINQVKLDKLYSELFKVRNAGQKIHTLKNMDNISSIITFLDSYEDYLLLKISEIKKIIKFSNN